MHACVSCAAFRIPLDDEGAIVGPKLILHEEVSNEHEFQVMEIIWIRSRMCIYDEPCNINNHV